MLATLSLILWKCNRLMGFKAKNLGYFIVLGVTAILLDIGVNAIIINF